MDQGQPKRGDMVKLVDGVDVLHEIRAGNQVLVVPQKTVDNLKGKSLRVGGVLFVLDAPDGETYLATGGDITLDVINTMRIKK